MTKFRIFYSWQSDLPGSKTKNFIRDCIDDAIVFAGESEAVEAIRDEATKDTTGSPNIVTTLFSKIDECDLFVADVTLCFTGDVEKGGVKKHSPNPNVMLELGYAVKNLGWERVICLCNTDYGTKYPFDIAQNRRTPYSLDGKDSKVVKRKIAKIIFTNIQDLRGTIPRAKTGLATHIVGTYDFDQKRVTSVLVPIKLEKQESFVLHNEELLNESRELVEKISSISVRIDRDQQVQPIIEEIMPQQRDDDYRDTVKSMQASITISTNPVVIKEQEEIRERIKRFLDIDVHDDFFNLGDLSKTEMFLSKVALNGTVEEKEKYKKLKELQHNLLLLDVRQTYLQTFNGLSFIPLAIQNSSTLKDTDIRVVVNVLEGTIIKPSEDLICEDLKDAQRLLCSDDDKPGIIPELFLMETDGIIHIEELPYEPLRNIQPITIPTLNGLQELDKTKEDYKDELEEYIAQDQGFYEFEVKSLRPNECKWLSQGMLIRPENGKVTIEYHIHSAHSSGNLTGVLTINTKEDEEKES